MLGHWLRRTLGALRVSRRGRPAEERFPGRVQDVERYLEALRRSADTRACLIIEVPGTPDFLQFSAAGGIIELDFPQISPRQRALGPALRQVAAEHGLAVRETAGSDGSRFLDVDLDGAAANTAEIVRTLLTSLFSVGADTPLDFICQSVRAGGE